MHPSSSPRRFASCRAAALVLGAVGAVAVVAFPTPAFSSAFQAPSAAATRSSFLASSSSRSSSSSSSLSFLARPTASTARTGRISPPSFLLFRPEDTATAKDQVGIFDPLGLAGLSSESTSHRRYDAPSGASALASAALSVALVAGVPGVVNAAASDLVAPSGGGGFDPGTSFTPGACPTSDGIYATLRDVTLAAAARGVGVGTGIDGGSSVSAGTKFELEATAAVPVLASGYGRIRSELCVAEGYWTEDLLPFVKANGLASWVFPAHETAETFATGTVVALTTAFLLAVSSRLLQVAILYVDAFVGGPSRAVGGFFSDRVGGAENDDDDDDDDDVAASSGNEDDVIKTSPIPDAELERNREKMDGAVTKAEEAVADAESRLKIAETRAAFETDEGDDVGDDLDAYVEVQQKLQGNINRAERTLERARAKLDERVEERSRALSSGVEAEVASSIGATVEETAEVGSEGGDTNFVFLVLGVVTKLVGESIGNARKVVNAVDAFVATYLPGIAVGYVVLKFVHLAFFPDAFSDLEAPSFPDVSKLSLPQFDGIKEGTSFSLPSPPDLGAIGESLRNKAGENLPSPPDFGAIGESLRNKAGGGNSPSSPPDLSATIGEAIRTKAEAIKDSAVDVPVPSVPTPEVAPPVSAAGTSAQDLLDAKIGSLLKEPPTLPPVESSQPPTLPEPAPAAAAAATTQ